MFHHFSVPKFSRTQIFWDPNIFCNPKYFQIFSEPQIHLFELVGVGVTLFSNVKTRTPTNFTLKKGSNERWKGLCLEGVLKCLEDSDRCVEGICKVSDRCLIGVLKVSGRWLAFAQHALHNLEQTFTWIGVWLWCWPNLSLIFWT